MISPPASVYQEYVDAYLAAARDLPFIDEIYVDTSDGLRIYTVYHGSLYDIGRELVEASGPAMDRFPRTPVNFHYFETDSVSSEFSSKNIVRVFPTR